MMKARTFGAGFLAAALLLGALSCSTPSNRGLGEGEYMAGEGTRDTSARRHVTPKDWFESGRKIKSRDSAGRIFLYWYDQEGRIMKMAGLAYTVSAKDPQPENGNPEAWVHCFTYTSQGELRDEINCVGERFPVAVGAKLTPERGTTLENHRHISATGWMGPKPAAQPKMGGGELWKEDK